MGWFATECHYTPDQVFDMPWPQLVALSLLADDMADARSNPNTNPAMSNRQPRRMV
jgi:hypothetical protein